MLNRKSITDESGYHMVINGYWIITMVIDGYQVVSVVIGWLLSNCQMLSMVIRWSFIKSLSLLQPSVLQRSLPSVPPLSQALHEGHVSPSYGHCLRSVL